ncbi:MAG: BtpA/SgcQ family protein [Chloroflexia bacterium]
MIGVVHLPPLPGAPGWDGDFATLLDRARTDLLALAEGGVDAVVIENSATPPSAPSRSNPRRSPRCPASSPNPPADHPAARRQRPAQRCRRRPRHRPSAPGPTASSVSTSTAARC